MADYEATIMIEFKRDDVWFKRAWRMSSEYAESMDTVIENTPGPMRSELWHDRMMLQTVRQPEKKQGVIRVAFNPDGITVTGTEAFQVDLTREADSVILELRP